MSIITSMSPQGEAALTDEEGEVLKAYRCPAGVLTIGVGLTAASGVVTPKLGMVITRAESRRLLRLALANNYEPRVAKALPTNLQHVFDGATMFDWNTGAIGRASWVSLFGQGLFTQAGEKFRQWSRAGGKVLPGLQARREREWAIIRSGSYPKGKPSALSEFAEYASAFKSLGFNAAAGEIATVAAFQRKYGLTVDGKIGPATRAAIKRALDAKTTTTSVTTGAVTGGATGGSVEVASNPTSADLLAPDTAAWVLGGALTLGCLVLACSLVWRFRGPLFSWMPEPAKDWFEVRGVVIGRRVRT